MCFFFLNMTLSCLSFMVETLRLRPLPGRYAQPTRGLKLFYHLSSKSSIQINRWGQATAIPLFQNLKANLHIRASFKNPIQDYFVAGVLKRISLFFILLFSTLTSEAAASLKTHIWQEHFKNKLMALGDCPSESHVSYMFALKSGTATKNDKQKPNVFG